MKFLLITAAILFIIHQPLLISARGHAYVADDCSKSECPKGPYCFGFLTKDADITTGGRDVNPDVDRCFNQPELELHCDGKPWASIRRLKTGFHIELIGKGIDVGFVLFEDKDKPDPMKPEYAIYCNSDKNQVLEGIKDEKGTFDWSAMKAVSTAKNTVEKEPDTWLVCEINMTEAYSTKLMLRDPENPTAYNVGFFEDGIPPKSDKLTSSNEPLTFFSELVETTLLHGVEAEEDEDDKENSTTTSTTTKPPRRCKKNRATTTVTTGKSLLWKASLGSLILFISYPYTLLK